MLEDRPEGGWKWEDLSRITLKAAEETSGTEPKGSIRPWLEGRGDQVVTLNKSVEAAVAFQKAAEGLPRPWTSETTDAVERAKKARRDAERCRKMTKKKWENEWWIQLSEQAEEAEEKGDTGRLYAILFRLSEHGAKKKDGSCASVEDPDKEREEWKAHFQKIQEGQGQVRGRVWNNVGPKRKPQLWMGEEPTDEEINRAIGNMANGRQGGEDQLVAELVKYGGDALRTEILNVVRESWREAAYGEEGDEARDWPEAWKMAIQVPIWKQKGCKSDKNTWRGITLLSVGTKVLARVVAARTQRWSEEFLGDEQNGFRRNRGVDDALQITRRVAESVTACKDGPNIRLTFHDLEKAYPRVCRLALWELMELWGADARFITICKALHDHTVVKVRVMGACSSNYTPERGLREGCPSSPPLFNVYHSAVMMDFRKRREDQAKESGHHPGIPWRYRIDGQIMRRAFNRRQARAKERGEVDGVLGDVEYADDTMLMGEEEEVLQADRILETTFGDWEQKSHPGKKEILTLRPGGSPAMHPRIKGEKEVVRHIGGWLEETAGQEKDTDQKYSAAMAKIRRVGMAWNRGGDFGRGRSSKLKRTTRLKVMRAVATPTLTTFARSRTWVKSQVNKLQKAQNYAVRIAMGVTFRDMRNHHLTDEGLRLAAGWETVREAIQRRTLVWLAHVARMPKERQVKQVVFGWVRWRARKTKMARQQTTWLEEVMMDAKIQLIDWFRRAQDKSKTGWMALVDRAFPKRRLTPEEEARLNAWRIGEALPTPIPKRRRMKRSSVPLDAYMGLPGRTQKGVEPEGGEYGQEEGANPLFIRCPACNKTCTKVMELRAHYEAEHAVIDPGITTHDTRHCEYCNEMFKNADRLRLHVCPKRQESTLRAHIERPGPTAGPAQPQPDEWEIYTDGSGVGVAGWGVAIFRNQEGLELKEPTFKLFGPVVTDKHSHLHLGADEGTNNTAEASAIFEALLWLKLEAPDNSKVGAIVKYDSEYAAGMAQGKQVPTTNITLVKRMGEELAKVRTKRRVTFEHVYGHVGIHGNEIADRLAARGATGEIGPDSKRWAAPAPEKWGPLEKENCGKCGMLFAGPTATRSCGAHELKCKLPWKMERVPGFHPCRLCGQLCKGSRGEGRGAHEKKCRGSDDANRTCRGCSLVFPTGAARWNHESLCKSLKNEKQEAKLLWRCRCGFEVRDNLEAWSLAKDKHVERCRGSDIANRTCTHCGRVFE